jgi:hypothetical protein
MRKFTIHFSSDVEDELDVRFVGPMDRIRLEDLHDLEIEFENQDGKWVRLPLFSSIRVHEAVE